MTPEQFLVELRRHPPASAYLFLGAESYQRNRCRTLLLERVLPEEERETGYERLDLEETTLAAVLDDARALSLFAPRRLIWAASAEAVLPRGRVAESEEEEQRTQSGDSGQALLATYLKDPTPGVVMVFEASRYGLEGEDKAKLERVRKFYAGIERVVEFPRYSPAAARRLAQELARAAGLGLGAAEADLLAEATGDDASRIAVELEKLGLYAGQGGAVDAETIARLVPNARAATIFALVAALGRGDRARALDLLDTLVREGEYLPLALSFLAAQFRQALVARLEKLRGPQQVQAFFSRQGTPMWPSKAQQVCQTMEQFSVAQMEAALRRIHAADRALRDTRPDDRIVMEEFVLSLTGQSR